MLRRSVPPCAPFVFGKNAYNSHDKPILSEPLSYINGVFVKGSSATAVLNPATGHTLGPIPHDGADETNAAIAAAKAAFPAWSNTVARNRAVILRKFGDLMLQHQEDLAAILTREAGKPLGEAGGEIIYSSRYLEWYAAEAERIYGDFIPDNRHGVRTTVMKRPVGVVGIVTPWNFPSAMITRAAAGAMAAGCTVVIKPSELTPFSALALAQLAEEAGVPKGVFNIVMGDAPAIGTALTDSFDVRKLSFTGSTKVGKQLTAQCSNTMKRVAMELGGNAPLIVFDDADPKKSVDGAMAAKFRNAGQTCVCANRVFVHEKVHDQFVEKVVAATKKLTVGDGLQKGITMGPLINAAARDRVAAAVKEAVKAGAVVATGGDVGPDSGHFYQPTVLTNCTNKNPIAQNEIFGPVMPIIKFGDGDDVTAMANDTRAGLAAYFFTESYKRQWSTVDKLQFGMIGINDGIMSAPAAPFGGVKESGVGRDGSKYGIDAFLDIHYVLHSNLL